MQVVRKIKPFHVDERGEMSYLLDKETKITSAILITCKKGSIRANHYHKRDTHYSFMTKGSMEYTYKKLKSQVSSLKSQSGTKLPPSSRLRRASKTVIVSTGEIVETPPNTLHAMKFLEDSVFIALTTESRDQEKYERDTVRVKLIP